MHKDCGHLMLDKDFIDQTKRRLYIVILSDKQNTSILDDLLYFIIHYLTNEAFSCFILCCDNHLIKIMELLDFALTYCDLTHLIIVLKIINVLCKIYHSTILLLESNSSIITLPLDFRYNTIGAI